jgi:Tfp pilus assembly protein PilF
VLSAPHKGETVGGRPLLNLSLALNYALGVASVCGYHAANLAVHVLNALLLWGILRRTFQSPILIASFGAAGPNIAWAIALLWAVHPLQTESVTYVVQRAESLAALFYLSTLYCVIRGASSARALLWYVAAALACLLGMATKETMATAPIIVLLYDRTFLGRSFTESLRRRWGVYVGLGMAWMLLATLVIGAHGRGYSVGFHSGVTAREYALTQCAAIVQYLRISFWPAGLCLDYGVSVARTTAEIVPGALLLFILASATLWALLRRPAIGFLGAFFLATLAPSSSFVPIATQTIAEHRMYLAAVVIGGDLLLGRLLRRLNVPQPRRAVLHGTIAAALIASATVALGARTWLRNEDYHTDLSLWEDAVRQRPLNPRVHNNYGLALLNHGRVTEAIERCRQALKINPNFADARNNLGNALARRGRFDEAIAQYQKALQVRPDYAEAHYNLGIALAGRGQVDEAVAQYQKALEIQPDYMAAHNNLGIALAGRGQIDAAIAHFQTALEIQPDVAEAHYNLGNALATCGQVDRAIPHYQRALEIQPGYVDARNNLGNELFRRGDFDEAIAQYRKVLEITPGYADARHNLAIVLARREEILKTLAERRESLHLRPNDTSLLNDTAWMLATNPNATIRNGREAVQLAQQAIKLSGEREPALLDTLAAACAEAGRFDTAVETAMAARRLAEAAGRQPLADDIQMRLDLYRGRKPFHERADKPSKR